MATKQKRNWRHPHKIKIHDNRWLVWTIAIAVILSATLVAYIQVSDIHFDSEMGRTSDALTGWATFEEPARSYTLKHPKTWGVEVEGEGVYSFVNTQNPNEYFSVAVYPAGQEQLVRDALISSREQLVTVAGMPATLITSDPARTEKAVLFSADESLYVLRGTGESFNRIVSSFRLSQKIE